MKGNIPNHPNYHITKDGRLFSNKSGEWVERKGQVYRGCPSFYFEGKWHRSSRLVATVYISNPYNYPIVMHKDNNRMNNHVSNLQWGTYSMNNLQCSREGRGKQYRQIGKLNPMYGKVNPMRGVTGKLHPSYGKPSWIKGKHQSESTKLKISLSLKALNKTKITQRKRRRIMRLRSEGKSQAYIANRLNLHQTTISKILQDKL